MYLRQLFLKNVGPIDEIDLKPNFNENDNPKPLILVGKNGGGKTFILSSIVDAIFEMQKQNFKDVNKNGAYFRISGGLNQKTNSDFALAFCEFFGKYQSKEVEEIKDLKFQYLEKTGKLEKNNDAFKKFKLEGITYETLEKDNVKKLCNQSNQESLKSDFLINSYCFFPANRHENPHWLNLDAIRDDKEEFNLDAKFSGRLEKPIYLPSTLKENKNWLMDVVLDWHVKKLIDTSIEAIYWNQAVNLLQGILEKQNIRFGIGERSSHDNRISIVENDASGKAQKTLIPSINNLSSGQTVLLNLFLTILRYSDSKPRRLEEIEGIVIIDEVDLHLHIDLQAKILPNLIKLFPKIQFILTSHSPIFLLGMKDVFGEEGFDIFSLPDGRKIGVEDYEEYKKAFEIIKFEDFLKSQNNQDKLIVIPEGKFDKAYIQKAAALLNKSDILKKIEFPPDQNLEKCGGYGTLDQIWSNKKNFLPLITNKVLLLYDCDTDKCKDENAKKQNRKNDIAEGKIFKIVIQKIDNNPVKAGIENLFPQDFCEKSQCFSSIEEPAKIVNGKKLGEDLKYFDFKEDGSKKSFCTWACENGTAEDFANFAQIFEIIENVLNGKNS